MLLTPSSLLSRPLHTFPLIFGIVASIPTPALSSSVTSEEVTISSVEVQGNATLSTETVLHYLGIQPGDYLDEEVLNRGLHALWSSGLVEEIVIETDPRNGEISIVVTVLERPLLVALEVRGLDSRRGREIESRRRQEDIELAEGKPLSMTEVHRYQALIEEIYREDGFPSVAVDVTTQKVSPGSVRVILSVESGEQIRIHQINFEGNSAFSAGRLRRALKKAGRSTAFESRGRRNLSEAIIDQSLEEIRNLYRRSGYKDVEIGEPDLETTTGVMTIPICEGGRWRMGAITLTGNRVLSDQFLLQALEGPRGDWLSFRFVDRTAATVTQLYQNRGHLDARVETELRERDGESADLVLKVTEGEVYRVGRVEIDGNTRTRDKVIRRRLPVQQGAVLNLGALRSALAEIDATKLFDLDDREPLQLEVDKTTHIVDIAIRGQEADPVQVQFSAGWGQLEELSGRLVLQSPNFLGRGETLALTLEAGGVDKGGSLFYDIPWLLDRPQKLGFNLFKRDRRIQSASGVTSVSDESGAWTRWGRIFGGANALSVIYQFKDVKQSLADSEADPVALFDSSSLQALYRRDTRNNPLDPASGYLFQGSLELAGGALGGDRSVWQPKVQFSQFQSLGRYPLRAILGLNIETGTIQPYDGYQLSPLEGYFLGGPSSVRGFRPSSIWTRDDNGLLIFEDGVPVGGDTFFQLNLEAQLFRREEVRLVLFADAGNVWGRGQSPKLSDLRSSAGMELRLGLRGIGTPVRLIYAVNLDPLAGDQFEEFRVAFGASF